jgi:hypothetical protein
MSSIFRNVSADYPRNLKVVTSCRGRFHIFDQARELARLGVLHRLIADYPVSHAERFGIPAAKVHSLLLQGALNHGYARLRHFFPVALQDRGDEFIHHNFSRRLPGNIPQDTDFFIGLSSFSLEGLQYCREPLIMAVFIFRPVNLLCWKKLSAGGFVQLCLFHQIGSSKKKIGSLSALTVFICSQVLHVIVFFGLVSQRRRSSSTPVGLISVRFVPDENVTMSFV